MKHHKFVYLLAFSFLLTLFFGVPTLAQSVYPISGQIRDHQGNVVPAATVIILSGNLTTVNTATQPGSPLATVYSDPAGTMVINQLTNPVTTSGTGQFTVYAPGGFYVVQAYRNNYQIISPTFINTLTGCTVGSSGAGQIVFTNGASGCDSNSQFALDSAIAPTTLNLPYKLNVSLPGIFTSTQMNDAAYSLLNSCSTLTEYSAEQGTGRATEGTLGCVSVPNTSTVTAANALAGFVNTSSSSTFGVGMYTSARCLANSTTCWGENPLAADVNGLTGVTLLGSEIDLDVHNSSTSGNGIILTGNGHVANTNFTGIQVQYGIGSNPVYDLGFQCNAGAVVSGTCLVLSTQSVSGANSYSQTINMSGRDALGVSHTAQISADPNGLVNLVPDAAHPYVIAPNYTTTSGDIFLGTSALLIDTGTRIATSSNNYACGPSPSGAIVLQNSVWNGTAAIADPWGFECLVGTGANPTSTLKIVHSGSSGTANLEVGSNFQVDGLAGVGDRCLHADASGNVTPTGADCGTGSGPGVSQISGDGELITNSASSGAVTLAVGAAAGHRYWGNNTGISTTAAFVQPAFGDLSGSAACSQLPALTGDATSSAGSCATTVVKINGASVPASAAVLGTNSSSQPVAATAHGVVTPLACADSSGSGTAQSCSTSPTFSPAVGDQIIYKTTTANTGDVTINVNAAGAVHVRKWLGSATLAAGDLAANIPELLTYDGSYWEVYTIGNAPSGSGSGIVSNCTTLGAMSYYAATGTTVSCLPSVVESAGQIALGVAGTTQGTLTFAGSTSGVVTVQPAAAAGTWTWTLPTTGGTANYFLQTNGSGVSTWAQPAFSELSGSVACSQLPALTGDATTSAGSCATTVTKVTGSFTTHGVLFGNGSSTFGVSAAGTLNQPLLSGGSSANGAYGDTPVIGTSGVYGIGASGTADTGLSRDAAGVVDVGNGSAGDFSGSMKMAGAYVGPGGSGMTPNCGSGVYSMICWGGDTNTPTPAAYLYFLHANQTKNCIEASNNGNAAQCVALQSSSVTFTAVRPNPTTYSSLPACANITQGTIEAITDSNTQVWGATAAGGGLNYALLTCDGSAWTVIGK